MKNFTKLGDVSNIQEWLQQAKEIKKNPFSHKAFGTDKTLGLVFFNPSLRTRMSTQKAAMNLGMNTMVMNISNDGWAIELEDGTVMNEGSQEHIKEAAGVLSQYCDIIGIRTFASLSNQLEDYQEKILSKFIQYALVPVVSLESAIRHPLQSFADLITIEEQKNTARPKVVLSWAPHPKPLPQAVANSFVEWVKETDADLVIANPEGFDLSEEFTEGVFVMHDQDEAFKGADFIYAKNWSSFSAYGKTTEAHNDWIITEKKMALTKNAKFMHCLPVRRNVVVSDEVIDGANSLVLEQANNRTYAAQTVILKFLKNEN
ncbi:MAG: N-acetylornithine carbamoyltransferase [Flavobacteriales bacterium]|nr:N-acetylornithine carbamoyltransferase [Flavobacteriales bacterium]